MNEPLQICNGEHHESNNFPDECITQQKRNTAQHKSFSISRNKNHYRHLDFALTLASFKTNIHTLIIIREFRGLVNLKGVNAKKFERC